MTTNFDRSKPIWRSMRGRVPRPIEPKPIITIGPSNRACTGQHWVTRVIAFIFGHSFGRERSRRPRKRSLTAIEIRPRSRTCKESGNERRKIGLRDDATGRVNQAVRAIEGAGCKLNCQQPMSLMRSGQPQGLRFFTREAETRIIRVIPDEEHGAMLTLARVAQGAAHERRPDTAVAAVAGDCERPKQERRPSRAGRDVPKLHGADHAAPGA